MRGEAGRVAMDIAEEKLMKPDGGKTLIEAMRAHVFPQARTEAKELYKMGHKQAAWSHGTTGIRVDGKLCHKTTSMVETAEGHGQRS